MMRGSSWTILIIEADTNLERSDNGDESLPLSLVRHRKVKYADERYTHT